MRTGRSNVQRILESLTPLYPDLSPLLEYDSPFQLLIAVILSAQCTDTQVNRVTRVLFARHPTPELLEEADLNKLEDIVHSTGFFRAKARNIRDTAEIIRREYQGTVPVEMDDLLRLPGVGRKSANVIRGICFGKPAVIVDTHFMRVVQRLGLVRCDDPGVIEKEIRKLVPDKEQTRFSMVLNRHGRAVCTARNPSCTACAVVQECDYGQSVISSHR